MHYKVAIIDILGTINVFLPIFLDDDQHIKNALKNLAKSIFISSNAQLELTNFLCFVLFCCCVVSSARLNARFGGLEYISSFTYLWYLWTYIRIIVQRKYIVNTSGEFHSSSQLLEMPRAYGRCIFSEILLSIHVETYILIKWIKMLTFRSIDWYSWQNFIRLEITRGDKWVKMLTLLLMHISTFGFNFEKCTCYISFFFVINNKNDSPQATA